MDYIKYIEGFGFGRERSKRLLKIAEELYCEHSGSFNLKTIVSSVCSIARGEGQAISVSGCIFFKEEEAVEMLNKEIQPIYNDNDYEYRDYNKGKRNFKNHQNKKWFDRKW